MLGRYAKLNTALTPFVKANSPKANRAGRLRLARSVAAFVSLYMGISLFTGISLADSSPTKTIDPKSYIKFNYASSEAICLIKLYGKESAFNPRAIGNLDSPTKSYVYGIPQLKNAIIKDMDPISQLNYGFKYIAHRYGKDGGACKAWEHWLEKGWH